MFVVIFECGEDEFLGGFREVGLDEEVSVEGAEVEVCSLRREGLFEKVVGFVVSVETEEHVSLPNFG